MAIVGIDLGTTNSLISCFIENKSVIIPNALGSSLTPSIVSVLKSGEIVVGDIAKERLITYPELTAAAFKRYMGTNKKYKLGKHSFSPTELSSFILKSLKADAQNYLKTEITEAIISVPAYFNDQQRRATKEAGELAGLKVERLINEPTAAAVAYDLHQIEDERKFIVFDLGGGTFDVSVLDLFDNVLEVRAIAGDNFLGGEDFDELLINYFINHFKLNKSEFNLKTVSALKKCAETCKIELSNNIKAEMNCNINTQNYSITITEKDFEEISYDLLVKIKEPLKKALGDSKITSRELDYVILVGGSTKMPIIRSFVAKMFSLLPLSSINPDEVVCLGAGVCAAMKERNESVRENVLTDVCPYTLGIDIAKVNEFNEHSVGHFLPIIERNTTIPYSKVETLTTICDNQKVITIGIYQGESRLVANNLKLGEISIKVPPLPKGRSNIDIRYTYDINGILEVEVTSLVTGETKREVIVNNDTNLTKEEIEKKLKMLDKIKIHPRDNTKNQFLISKAERLYEETLSDLRNQISDEISRFETVLDRQKTKEIEEAVKRFEKFLKSIDEWEL